MRIAYPPSAAEPALFQCGSLEQLVYRAYSGAPASADVTLNVEDVEFMGSIEKWTDGATAVLGHINRTPQERRSFGFTTLLYSSRRAVTTGSRAARMAGSSPPT